MRATTNAFALLFVLPNLASCTEQKSGPSTPSSAETPAPSVPSASPSAPEAAAPDDLDVKTLQKQLVCPADAKSGPCAVLAAMASCKVWTASTPSGDGRWIGKGHRVEGGKTSEEVTILRARRVPSSEVGPGQLPLKVGIADINKGDGAAFDQAERAIKAFARHDVPSRGNVAVEFLQRKDTWPEGFALRTVGGQVYVAMEGGAFVCQGQQQQIFVVQRAATRGGKAEGLYAEVWPSTW